MVNCNGNSNDNKKNHETIGVGLGMLYDEKHAKISQLCISNADFSQELFRYSTSQQVYSIVYNVLNTYSISKTLNKQLNSRVTSLNCCCCRAARRETVPCAKQLPFLPQTLTQTYRQA